jgi:hypothetical protein
LVVVSLFDGIAGALRALKLLGIRVKAYFAVEKDPVRNATQLTQHPTRACSSLPEDYYYYYYSLLILLSAAGDGRGAGQFSARGTPLHSLPGLRRANHHRGPGGHRYYYAPDSFDHSRAERSQPTDVLRVSYSQCAL